MTTLSHKTLGEGVSFELLGLKRDFEECAPLGLRENINHVLKANWQDLEKQLTCFTTW